MHVRRSSWLRITSLALATLLLAPPAVRAEITPFPCSLVTDPDNAPSTDPRVDHLVVGGVKVTVLVPPRYQQNQRRHPVLYLFHGAFGDQDSMTTQTDLIAFTGDLPDHEQAIVVMPDGGHLPAASDWVDGTHPQESYFIGTLVPYIDAHYRTIEGRAHRATAGFSGGGLDSMLYAARHPDMFVAAGSFSGFVDQLTEAGVSIVAFFAELDNELCGASTDPLGIWGDPAVHPMGWEGHDPTDLAPSLRGISLYIASGNGEQCPGGPPPDPFNAEGAVYEMSLNFDAALTAAAVPHVTDFYGCGVHLESNVSRDLRPWWPQMLAAFGGKPPSEFDYRTADAVAEVWGWTFRTDTARAPEFLDVRHASAAGLTITGSGATGITTAALFRRGQIVSVVGAASAPFVSEADDEGRISFTVDLGQAHTLEQDTDAERLAAANDPGYFVTRTVTLTRLGDDADDEQ